VTALVSINSVRCVVDARALLGEGPLWDPRIDCLIWLDIKGQQLFVYDPASGENEEYTAPDMVSAIGLAEGGGYVCVNRNGFHRLHINGRALLLDPITDPEKNLPENRFNDGKVDPSGGFWAGTMHDSEQSVSGSWWRLAPKDKNPKKLMDGFMVTNGPAFDAEQACVYLTVSSKQIIYKAFTDGASVTDVNPFLRFEAGNGYPDGMEVDRFGCLWVAFWDGGEVRRFSNSGQLLQSVPIGVPRPTSLAFVGSRLYITSARIGLDEKVIATSPQSGGLFCVETDTILEKSHYNQCIRM